MVPFLVTESCAPEHKSIRDSLERAVAFAIAVMGRNACLQLAGVDVGEGWVVKNNPLLQSRYELITLSKEVEEAGSIEGYERRMMIASVYVSAFAVTSPRRTITFTIIDYEKEIDDEKEGGK